MKTANQLYRESGSSEPFKDWLEAQKCKNNLLQPKSVETSSSFAATGDSTSIELFGINIKYILLAGVLITAGVIVYKKYKSGK